MIINFINFLVNCCQSSWNFKRIFCSMLHSRGGFFFFFFFWFHLISDACSAWVSKLLKGYWSLLIAVTGLLFFDAQAMLFFRCFYRVWNIRFVYIPWSEGNQEEDGNRQIQLNGSVGVSWCNCWFACQWLYGQNQDRKVEACNEWIHHGKGWASFDQRLKFCHDWAWSNELGWNFLNSDMPNATMRTVL